MVHVGLRAIRPIDPLPLSLLLDRWKETIDDNDGSDDDAYLHILSFSPIWLSCGKIDTSFSEALVRL